MQNIKFYVTKVTSPELDVVPAGAAFYICVTLLAVLFVLVAVSTGAEHFASPEDGNGEATASISNPENGHVPLLRKGDDIENGAKKSMTNDSRSKSKLPFLFKVFSAKTNIGKLCKHDAKSETAALNGMRVLSMAWIILGHTFLMPQAIAGYDNPDEVVGHYGWFWLLSFHLQIAEI